MTTAEQSLLDRCHFPAPGTEASLAVSGGPDSRGMLLLSLAADLRVRVHHVDHHARPTSTDDARYVLQLGETLGLEVVVHDVQIAPGPNFESRARAARRGALPEGALTGHTMDDLAETVLLNMLRGAGVDGLSPMVGDPTKPLLEVRRAALHTYVAESGWHAVHDETNDNAAFQRNRVRHELLALACDVAGRDVVPILARQAQLIHDDRAWLDELSRDDRSVTLSNADCRVLRAWPTARLRRWLRHQLRHHDQGDGEHPPSAGEVARALSVVRGEIVATELEGGRRLARRGQHLTLDEGSPLR